MIVNGFPEISEKFLVNQVTGLMDAGADLDVYSALSPPAGKGHELAERYGLRERTIYARAPRSAKARLAELPGLFAACAAQGPRNALRALDSGRYATAARNFKNLYFLRAFGARRYDVVHCHFGPNGLVGAFLKDCGIAGRLVVTFHGSDINTYPRRYGVGVYRRLYEKADIVTVNSRFTMAKVVENGCASSKIEILPVGLRMEEYPAVDPALRETSTILTVGRLVEKKGHRYAIEAFARVRKRFPDALYLIVGDGPLRGELELLVRELELGDSVRFLGAKGDKEVAALYARASIFVLASVTASDGDMEGQGLVLQEAQASGLPVVSTLHNGIPDGVLDGKSGFLVPERDVGALAEKIESLFGDEALRREMGAVGRSFVSGAYDVPGLTRRVMALYARVTGSTIEEGKAT
jgi:colanic acid/amylovoran biosynthesis glycosyltransferase